MDDTEVTLGSFTPAVLLSFTFGALMTLLYSSRLIERLPMLDLYALTFFAVLFAIDGFVFSSLAGLTVYPLLSVLTGAAAAIRIDSALLCANTGAADIRLELLFLSVAVPLHFVISIYGMHTSLKLRCAVDKSKTVLCRFRLLPYAIIFIGVAVSAVLLRYILK